MRRPCIIMSPDGETPTEHAHVIAIAYAQDEAEFTFLVERRDGTCEEYHPGVIRLTDGGGQQAPYDTSLHGGGVLSDSKAREIISEVGRPGRNP